MPRTTAGAVEQILGADYDGQTDLNPFIDSASVVVDRVVSMASAKGLPLVGAEPELIERWLSAHMYAQSDKPYASKSTGGASASFQGQTAQGIESTLYGQNAIRIDYSGCLQNLDKKQRMVLKWLGKPPSQQIPYWQRD